MERQKEPKYFSQLKHQDASIVAFVEPLFVSLTDKKFTWHFLDKDLFTCLCSITNIGPSNMQTTLLGLIEQLFIVLMYYNTVTAWVVNPIATMTC